MHLVVRMNLRRLDNYSCCQQTGSHLESSENLSTEQLRRSLCFLTEVAGQNMWLGGKKRVSLSERDLKSMLNMKIEWKATLIIFVFGLKAEITCPHLVKRETDQPPNQSHSSMGNVIARRYDHWPVFTLLHQTYWMRKLSVFTQSVLAHEN